MLSQKESGGMNPAMYMTREMQSERKTMQHGFMGANNDLPSMDFEDNNSHYTLGEDSIKQVAPAISRAPSDPKPVAVSKEMSIVKFNEISAPPRMTVQSLWPDAKAESVVAAEAIPSQYVRGSNNTVQGV